MKNSALLLIAIAAFVAISCASQQPARQAETPAVAGGVGMMVSAANEALKPAADALDVFPPNKSNLSSRNKSIISSKCVAIVKDVVNKLPAGYVVQVTGHSALVKDEATDSVSTGRAKAVYNELVRAGVDRNKLTYKGVGTSELIPGIGGLNPKQRRVSFKVVPK